MLVTVANNAKKENPPSNTTTPDDISPVICLFRYCCSTDQNPLHHHTNQRCAPPTVTPPNRAAAYGSTADGGTATTLYLHPRLQPSHGATLTSLHTNIALHWIRAARKVPAIRHTKIRSRENKVGMRPPELSACHSPKCASYQIAYGRTSSLTQPLDMCVRFAIRKGRMEHHTTVVGMSSRHFQAPSQHLGIHLRYASRYIVGC